MMCGLTAKQRAVLDLLIEHKTSKEISRTLGISRHTVDQRILLARAKLQVGSRNEVAQAYRRLLTEGPPGFRPISGPVSTNETYHRSIYGLPDVAEAGKPGYAAERDGPGGEFSAVLSAQRDQTGSLAHIGPTTVSDKPAEVFFHVLPEVFDGRGGTLLRLGAISLITVFLTLIILGGIAIYSELAHILDNAPGG